MPPPEPSRSEHPGRTTETLSQWQLIRRRFARHRLASWALYFLALLYLLAIFAEFVAPYTREWRNLDFAYCPPQTIRLNLSHGLHAPAYVQRTNPVTFQKTYELAPERSVPLGFFVKGVPYKLWGLIPWNRHFLGVDCQKWGGERSSRSTDPGAPTPVFYLLGADKYGQDVFSRIVYGMRISLSVGIVGIVIMYILGCTIGGISGYVGGTVDTLIQRTIEIFNSFPRLPLWLALGAVMPTDWSPLRVYFAITIVLSLLSWPGMARVVRGKILSLREEDYATAAYLMGAGHARIIFRHLLPGFTSHIIVRLTLSVPGMILGETSLSFLGLGLRPPIVSWGVMLQDCMNVTAVANYPWLLSPVMFIVVTVLCYNFVGDGLRDAADPYASR